MTLFTPHEAAVQLKVRASTVIKMFNNGELPGVILGEALQQFITAKEQRMSQAK